MTPHHANKLAKRRIGSRDGVAPYRERTVRELAICSLARSIAVAGTAWIYFMEIGGPFPRDAIGRSVPVVIAVSYFFATWAADQLLGRALIALQRRAPVANRLKPRFRLKSLLGFVTAMCILLGRIVNGVSAAWAVIVSAGVVGALRFQAWMRWSRLGSRAIVRGVAAFAALVAACALALCDALDCVFRDAWKYAMLDGTFYYRDWPPSLLCLAAAVLAIGVVMESTANPHLGPLLGVQATLTAMIAFLCVSLTTLVGVSDFANMGVGLTYLVTHAGTSFSLGVPAVCAAAYAMFHRLAMRWE